MNKKEKGLSLRIINELIKSYKKIDFTPPKKASDEPSVTTILTPSWLVNIKQELIFGKYIRLADVIKKITTTLFDSLRGMGPLLIAFYRILLHEQILHYEIQKLPRSLKNDCKIPEPTKKKSIKKPTKMTMKRRGDKKYFTLQSCLLNSVIDEQDQLKEDKFSSNTPPEVNPESTVNLKETIENNSQNSRTRKRPTQSRTTKQDNKKDGSKTEKKTVPKTRKSIASPKVTPVKKIVATKKSVAVRKPQNHATDKSNCKRQKQSTRVQKLLDAATVFGCTSKSRSLKKPETFKLGKRKASISDNNETIINQSNNTETGIKTIENSDTLNGPQCIKLKRLTCIEDRQLQQNQIDAKIITIQSLHSEMTALNDLMLGPDENSSKPVSTTTPGIRTSTPIKGGSSSTNNEDKPDFIRMCEEHIITQISSENDLENKIPEKPLKIISTATTSGGGKGKYSNQIWRKKHNSKFQQKGNQLMGIEEEEILDLENDNFGKNTSKNHQNKQVLTKESGLTTGVDPKTTSTETADSESNLGYSHRTLRSTSNSSKHQIDSVTRNPMDESSSPNDNEEDDDPVVLKMVTNQTYSKIKQKILRLLDNVQEKQSDVVVEKIIVNETISDDDEHGQQFTGSIPQKKGSKCTIANSGEEKPLPNKETAPSCSKSSPSISKTRPIGKKRIVKVYGKKEEAVSVNVSKENDTVGELITNQSIDVSNIPINESIMSKAEQWLTTELMDYENNVEALTHMPQIPEISCFLHVCQKALHLPFFTHYEFEHSLIIPHASCLMATVVTALLSGSPSSKETKTCSPLPYLQWNRKLTARLSHWFLIYQRLKHGSKVQDLIGIEPSFWSILGSKRNPLSLKPFHQLPLHQRVTILKGLCDHLFHVSKKIQTALISTPRGGREGKWLGEDNQGRKYLHIPIFLRDGFGDLRIYSVDNTKAFPSAQDEPFQVNKTSNESDGDQILAKNKSKSDSENIDQSHYLDKTFSMVAENVEKLNALVATVCSPFLDEELVETEKKMGQQEAKEEIKIKDETSDQESIVEDGDTKSIEIHTDIDTPSPRNEHLFLAAKLQSLAKYLNPMENILYKSQSAALVKLFLEWIEFNKDGFIVTEKSSNSAETHPRRCSGKRSKEEGKEQQDDNFEEPTNIKIGQQPLPMRKSLSRKAKTDAGKLMLEKDTKSSRKEIVAEMEENALVGCSNLIEEEMKWDISLWADEDSDDETETNEPSVEDSMWYGYFAIQKEVTQKGKNHNITSINDGSHLPLLTKFHPRIVKTSTKINTLGMEKKKQTHDLSFKPNLKIDRSVLATVGGSINDHDEVKMLSDKRKGMRMNSYKIKIRKEDLDSCLNKNEPGLLIDLVRKNMVPNNHMNALTNINVIPFSPAHSSNNNSTEHLQPGKKDNLININKINPSQSLTKKIINSFKRNTESSQKGSKELLATEFPVEQSSSEPLKVVKLKVPVMKETGGKGKVYSKQEMEKVTQLVLKAVKEINKNGSSNVPQLSQKDTTLQKDCETFKDVNDIQMVKIKKPLDHNGTPDKSIVVKDISDLDVDKDVQLVSEDKAPSNAFSLTDSAMIKDEYSDHEEISMHQHSGFKPFPLKSLKETSTDSSNVRQ